VEFESLVKSRVREIDLWRQEVSATIQANSPIFLEGEIDFDMIQITDESKVVADFAKVIKVNGIEEKSVESAIVELAKNYENYSSLSTKY
jgi:hypothetical protein